MLSAFKVMNLWTITDAQILIMLLVQLLIKWRLRIFFLLAIRCRLQF